SDPGECGPGISTFFFSSRRRHTRSKRDWSSDVCSSDLNKLRRDELVERVDKHTDGEFEFVGEFINMSSQGSFRHKACGTVFQNRVRNIFKRDKVFCEVCHPEARTRPYTDEEFDSKIKTELGSDYELSGNYAGTQTRVNIRHSTCDEVYSSDAS